MALSGKKILLGITGGIAAYKCCELIRAFVKLNADVKVVLTSSAKEFITETTLRTLSKNPVYVEQFDVVDWKPEHINLADSADIFVIAPATANTIGKIANGICDNLLTSLVAAFSKKIVVAPAMNCNMWTNQFVQKNVQSLESAGYEIIQPTDGDLACGYSGNGRMAEVSEIVDVIKFNLIGNKRLKGKKIIVTAGGTKEELDPVRYIGNYSSGKMGIAIADAAYSLGAEVVLISSVKVKKPYRVEMVKSAFDMLEALKQDFQSSDALIMAAAVADYRPKYRADNKIKKTSGDEYTVELVKNPDILKEISGMKRENQLLIGFSAETDNVIENATKKIHSKNIDFIVANDVSKTDIGFNSDYNKITIIDKLGNSFESQKLSKSEIAKIILERTLYGQNISNNQQTGEYCPT